MKSSNRLKNKYRIGYRSPNSNLHSLGPISIRNIGGNIREVGTDVHDTIRVLKDFIASDIINFIGQNMICSYRNITLMDETGNPLGDNVRIDVPIGGMIGNIHNDGDVTFTLIIQPFELVPGSNQKGQNFAGTDFTGIDLSRINFAGSDLSGCNFTNADLTDTKFDRDETYVDPNLNFPDANLTGAVFRNVTALRTSFPDGANFRGLDFSNSNLSGAALFDVDFTNANLENANLTNAEFFRTIFRGANLDQTIFNGTHFYSAIGADVTNADLTGAILQAPVVQTIQNQFWNPPNLP